MFYCFVHPENIEKILEQSFVKTAFLEKAEVCKYKNCFAFKSEVLNVYNDDGHYTLQDPEFIIDDLVRKIELVGNGYSIADGTKEVIYEDEEIIAEVQPSRIEFLIYSSFSNSKKLGSFIECVNRTTEDILLKMLGKYEIVKLETKDSRELNIINLLKKMGKF